MMVQPRLDCRRSRVVLKDFATGLGFVFVFMAAVERREDFNTEEPRPELSNER